MVSEIRTNLHWGFQRMTRDKCSKPWKGRNFSPFLTISYSFWDNGHLKIGIINIMISKDMQSFMKICALVFELLHSQLVWGRWGGLTRLKSLYPQTAYGDILHMGIYMLLHFQSHCAISYSIIFFQLSSIFKTWWYFYVLPIQKILVLGLNSSWNSIVYTSNQPLLNDAPDFPWYVIELVNSFAFIVFTSTLL